MRQIEVYRAAHVNVTLRVFFLVYQDSLEERKYLRCVRRSTLGFVKGRIGVGLSK